MAIINDFFMQPVTPLEEGKFHHVYNRGNNKENLFLERENYFYFLRLWDRHIEPIAETYAYCLMKNHFHFLIKIKDCLPMKPILAAKDGETPLLQKMNPSRQFSNLFNAYTKSINKSYDRTGSLFEERFGRIEVNKEIYFTRLIYYIHYNPQKHKFAEDYKDYEFSSYHSHLSDKATKLRRESVLEWFGNKNDFLSFHQSQPNCKDIQSLIIDDN